MTEPTANRSMKIVRTRPTPDPELLRGRAYIQDEAAECYIRSYDNRPLQQFEADLVVMEWDIAVSHGDLLAFCQFAAETPDEVVVAPYLLYPPTDERFPGEGVYAHRKVTNPVALAASHIRYGDYHCDLFGLGLTYLPRAIIDGFCEDAEFNAADRRMTDANLSMWHYRRINKPVRVAWHIHPVHLHYTMPKEFEHGV